MVQFEGKERRMPKIEACLKEYGIESLEAARDLCLSKGVNVDEIVKGIQPIAFENAVWAYTLGTAIALKKGVKKAADAAETIGIGLQAFCVPGSVAETRSVGLGHGNLGAMLLREETDCFCFLAGHESFAPSASPAPPTRPGNLPCGSSSTAWAKTPHTSSPGSTASPMWRRSMTSPLVSLKKSAGSRSLMEKKPRSTSTAPTTCWKALPS